MSKLTLSVDSEVVARAKEYARQHGLSVSEMVESYLSAVTHPRETARNLPVLRELRGSLKTADVDDYRKHLEKKFR